MADREGGGVPYSPNLVPQAQLDQLGAVGSEVELTPEGVQRQLIDLERFLEEELTRIATAMLAAVVQAAYAALTVDPGPAADQPLDATPTLIQGWNNFTPSIPNRVTTDQVVQESLVPEEGGIYQITAVMTVTVDAGSLYALTFTVNGTPTGVFSSIDASQQTTVVSFVMHGLLALNPGDVCTIFGIAQAQGAPHTFIMESAIFSIIRVSERNDERGIF